MNWKTTLGMALAGVMLTAPAWTHHAAEGIVSDDIWLRIDLQVSDMHQEIFEEVMGTLRVDEAPEGGSMFLVSYADDLTLSECEVLEEALREALNDETEDWVHDPNGDTEGDYNNTFMPVLYEDELGDACICDGDFDDCTIALWEPIGSVGWHDEDEDPAEVIDEGEPGPNPDGGKKGN